MQHYKNFNDYQEINESKLDRVRRRLSRAGRRLKAEKSVANKLKRALNAFGKMDAGDVPDHEKEQAFLQFKTLNNLIKNMKASDAAEVAEKVEDYNSVVALIGELGGDAAKYGAIEDLQSFLDKKGAEGGEEKAEDISNIEPEASVAEAPSKSSKPAKPYKDAVKSAWANKKEHEMLQKGSKGDDVKILQAFLKDKGMFESIITKFENVVANPGDEKTVDGIFGPGTQKALIKYQKANGLRPTGKLNTITARKIYADLGIETPPVVKGDPESTPLKVKGKEAKPEVLVKDETGEAEPKKKDNVKTTTTVTKDDKGGTTTRTETESTGSASDQKSQYIDDIKKTGKWTPEELAAIDKLDDNQAFNMYSEGMNKRRKAYLQRIMAKSAQPAKPAEPEQKKKKLFNRKDKEKGGLFKKKRAAKQPQTETPAKPALGTEG